MKNLFKFFSIVSFITFASAATAQQPGLGLKGGLNLSSFDGGGDSDTRIGLNIGGYYNSVLTGDFAVQPEAAISLEGDDNTSFTNLNLGVMGKLNFEELMLEFGPQLGLILGDDDANASATNFTVGFGAGYSFSSNMTLGLRYNAGLSDVSDGGDITNNTLSINIFYGL
ncbi:outer membrane beta-barrel protein [Ekhidna sp.]|uniref:outer membrane beta-barrel protein n=1 Tax=Ekhidna sp. TaxID=2608089 RepID=UPI003CCC3D49